MLQKAATAFGIVFILIGVLGFIPAFTTPGVGENRLLLGLFEVDGSHNLVHILSGVAALVAAAKVSWSRLYFQVFGVVYALVTLLGLFMDPVLGIIPVNVADNLLHLVITLAALYLGFVYKTADRDTVATA